MKFSIIVGVIAVVVLALIAGNYFQETSNIQQEILIISEEFTIYQDYLDVIEARHFQNIYDTGTIEATVISLIRSEMCPYTEEECRIQPYPIDTGVVRIDKIISYIPYSEQTVQQPIEQPSEGESSGEGKTTPGYTGQDLPKSKLPEYKQLEEGQEVSTIFQLTARPVKVIYTSIPPTTGGLESQQTVSRQIEPTQKTYKPISVEGDRFVFTTKIITYPETSLKLLPGLKEGDKFRATITYDGILHVNEYGMI